MRFSTSAGFWEVVGVLWLQRFWSLVPAHGFAVGRHPLQKETKNVELMESVLRNDRAWRFVLDRKIKLSPDSRPPYFHEFELSADAKQTLGLIDDHPAEVVLTAPLPIIQTVLNRFRWLGSYVDYAVFVLHKAFVCTTYEFLRFQIDLIKRLAKKAESGSPAWQSVADRPLTRAWTSVVTFVDKVTAMHGDLEMLTDLAYEYTVFLVEDPERSVHVLTLMAREIEEFTGSECERIEDVAILRHFGVATNPDYLSGDAASYKEIENVFDRVVRGMIAMFGELNAETMSMKNWVQVLDFKIAVREHINLYLKVDKILAKDEIGMDILKQKEDKYERKLKELSDQDADSAKAEGYEVEIVIQ